MDSQGAVPGRGRQALVTVWLLSGQSATERSGLGRSGGAMAAGQGPQAVLSWLPSSVPAPAALPPATQSSGMRSAHVVLSARESPL
jgi:hypothetical protein